MGLPDPKPGTSVSTVNQQAKAAPGQGGLRCPRPQAVHPTGLLLTLSLCRALFSSPSTSRSFLATPMQGRSVRTPRWHATPKPARKEGGGQRAKQSRDGVGLGANQNLAESPQVNRALSQAEG